MRSMNKNGLMNIRSGLLFLKRSVITLTFDLETLFKVKYESDWVKWTENMLWTFKWFQIDKWIDHYGCQQSGRRLRKGSFFLFLILQQYSCSSMFGFLNCFGDYWQKDGLSECHIRSIQPCTNYSTIFVWQLNCNKQLWVKISNKPSHVKKRKRILWLCKIQFTFLIKKNK